MCATSVSLPYGTAHRPAAPDRDGYAKPVTSIRPGGKRRAAFFTAEVEPDLNIVQHAIAHSRPKERVPLRVSPCRGGRRRVMSHLLTRNPSSNGQCGQDRMIDRDRSAGADEVRKQRLIGVNDIPGTVDHQAGPPRQFE